MHHQVSSLPESEGVELKYPAWLETAYGVMSCTIVRIAAGYARIHFAEDRPLSEEFDLWLTQNGGCRRHCRLIERTENQVVVYLLQEDTPKVRMPSLATFRPLPQIDQMSAV